MKRIANSLAAVGILAGIALVGFAAGFTWGPIEHYWAYLPGLALLALGMAHFRYRP